MTRVYKYQVEKLMNEVSKMEGSNHQYHDLRKETTSHGQLRWRVNYYDALGNWKKCFVGDTLADAYEGFELRIDEALYREEQAAKWALEESRG